MRTLSSQALQALYAQETATAFHLLITISHPTLAQPFTLTSDSIPTVSNGTTFNPFPFEISLPDDDPEKIPEAKLTIDAVDLSIIDAVRGFGTVPATITIQVVTSVTPNVVELEIGPLTLRDVTYDALTVQGAMRFEEILNEPFPGDLVSPATIPGVFLLT